MDDITHPGGGLLIGNLNDMRVSIMKLTPIFKKVVEIL